jgi:hypothetical protein
MSEELRAQGTSEVAEIGESCIRSLKDIVLKNCKFLLPIPYLYTKFNL